MKQSKIKKETDSTLISQQFIYSIKEHEILPFVIQVNQWIEKQLPLEQPHEVFFFKSKLIITELVTNAIKHAKTDDFKLDVEIDKQVVIFRRTDNGKPFDLFSDGQEITWPISDSLCGKSIMILKDKMSNMFAVIKDNYSLEFRLEEFTKSDDEVINTLIEHYGLIIITKLSDRFVYRYNTESHLNVFEASVGI